MSDIIEIAIEIVIEFFAGLFDERKRKINPKKVEKNIQRLNQHEWFSRIYADEQYHRFFYTNRRLRRYLQSNKRVRKLIKSEAEQDKLARLIDKNLKIAR